MAADNLQAKQVGLTVTAVEADMLVTVAVLAVIRATGLEAVALVVILDEAVTLMNGLPVVVVLLVASTTQVRLVQEVVAV